MYILKTIHNFTQKHIELEFSKSNDLYPMCGDLQNTKLKDLPSAIVSLLSAASLFPYINLDGEIPVTRYAGPRDLHLAPIPCSAALTSALGRLSARLIDLPPECLLPSTLSKPIASRLLRQLRGRARPPNSDDPRDPPDPDELAADEILALAAFLRPSLTSLDGLALCVRASGEVGAFPTPLYAHSYAHLLPGAGDLFAASALEASLGRVLLRSALKPFDVGALASTLHRHLPAAVYRSRLRDYFVWDSKSREPLTDEWAAALWTFVDETYADSTPTTPRPLFTSSSIRSISVKSPLSPAKSPLSPVKSPLFPAKSPLSPAKSRIASSQSVQDLHLLDDWYIIPAIQQRGNTKVHLFTFISISFFL